MKNIIFSLLLIAGLSAEAMNEQYISVEVGANQTIWATFYESNDSTFFHTRVVKYLHDGHYEQSKIKCQVLPLSGAWVEVDGAGAPDSSVVERLKNAIVKFESAHCNQ